MEQDYETKLGNDAVPEPEPDDDTEDQLEPGETRPVRLEDDETAIPD